MIVRAITLRQGMCCYDAHPHGLMIVGRHFLASPCRQCLRSMSTTVDAVQGSPSEPVDKSKKLLKSFTKRKPRGKRMTRGRILQLLGETANKNSIGMGTRVEKSMFYEPHELVANPPCADDLTLEMLLSVQSHLGHATSRWNPLNQKYIYGVREGVHIISLETTLAYLRRAARVIEGVAYHGGLILFAGMAKSGPALRHAAIESQNLYLHQPWQAGSITNREMMMANIKLKVIGPTDREIAGYEEKLETIAKPKPDLVVVLNTTMQYSMLHECGLNNIPTIGVVDTDADPSWVTYPIPANDDRYEITLACIQCR